MNNLFLTGNRRQLHHFNLKIAVAVVIIFVLLTIVSYVNELAKAGLLEKRSLRKRVMHIESKARVVNVAETLANDSWDVAAGRSSIQEEGPAVHKKGPKHETESNIDKNNNEKDIFGENHRFRRDAQSKESLFWKPKHVKREDDDNDGKNKIQRPLEVIKTRKHEVPKKNEKYIALREPAKFVYFRESEKDILSKIPKGHVSVKGNIGHAVSSSNEAHAFMKGMRKGTIKVNQSLTSNYHPVSHPPFGKSHKSKENVQNNNFPFKNASQFWNDKPSRDGDASTLSRVNESVHLVAFGQRSTLKIKQGKVIEMALQKERDNNIRMDRSHAAHIRSDIAEHSTNNALAEIVKSENHHHKVKRNEFGRNSNLESVN